MLGASALGWPREMIWGERWEGDSGLGTHVHLWLIHVNVWQNQYGIVKQNKVKIRIKKKEYIWISSNEVDETGADYTEWSKPERKTPTQYTNTYIWNLERW